MTRPPVLTTFTLTATAVAGGFLAAAPASAGGIGDFLSPAFGKGCANLDNGAHADGATRSGTGTVGGNSAGPPIGNPTNQCGGADLPRTNNNNNNND
ncbi:hypothetical protein [Streptomyces sp. NPDC023327]|uniref:hypothetical protein n=1 Tax=Streptomyces sp. NPDC023327 TaxID=3157088 RepID=UPI0033DB2ED5